MKSIHQPINRPPLVYLFTCCLLFMPLCAQAEISSHTVKDFTFMPIDTGATAIPLVMLAASNDHQNFFKAYNDFTDVDGDGTIDTTYKHSIDYYGYFDSYKCYGYEEADIDGDGTNDDINADGTAADKIFVPKAVTADKYCTGANDGYWSGNFLNWVSMANIDAYRKILFGGQRRYDGADGTVLERTYLPHDAHSWAKHYNGNDLEDLTPFEDGTHYTSADADDKKEGITFCNTTDVSGSTGYSHDINTATNPPLIKVVKGNYSLWASNERWQCTWDSGAPTDNHSASNSNNAASSGIDAYGSSPAYSEGIGAKNYIARVQACVSTLLGEENCKEYPGPDGKWDKDVDDEIYKPIGLLQTYGDTDLLYFGMMAGSYSDHASGGALIRELGSISEEINVNTTGTFSKVASTQGGPIGSPYNNAEGLINAWSLFRLIGYNHAQGTYRDGSDSDDCDWGLSDPDLVTDSSKCRNWGNPFSEIYMETVRYLAGVGHTGNFVANASNVIDGLPTPQTPYPNPLDDTNYCAPLNIINFNSSVSSYDWDELDDNVSNSGIYNVWESADRPPIGYGRKLSAVLTDIVGDREGLHGNNYFIGEVTPKALIGDASAEDQLCTAKTVNHFGDIAGLCPDAPRLQGSFRIAGLAYYAHVKDIQNWGNSALPGDQLIDTFSVSSASQPKIEIPDPLATSTTAVTLLPACRNTSLSPNGNCAIVDFKIVSQTVNNYGATNGVGHGQIYVNWEDSEQGGDYDQDMWGTIEYTINSNTNQITITTDVLADSTPYEMGFGYVISGTTKDGFHVHSGINGFTFSDSSSVTDCNAGCNVGDASTNYTFNLGASSASLLNDPLWYAAKYGGFSNNTTNTSFYVDFDGDGVEDAQADDLKPNGDFVTDYDGDGNRDVIEGMSLPIPDNTDEWDRYDVNGQPNPDGIPDNYFYASNPAQIEDSLNTILLRILQRISSGTAAAVVSNNIRGDGAIYQAYYEAYRKDADVSTKEAHWFGTIHGLWIDTYGNMREDGNFNGGTAATLDDYTQDMVLISNYNNSTSQTEFYRFPSSDAQYFTPIPQAAYPTAQWPDDWDKFMTDADGDGTLDAALTATPLEEIKTIWNAREQLYLSTGDTKTQRTYTTAANQHRHILTWVDNDHDGLVDANEYIDFTPAAFNTLTSGNYSGYFDLYYDTYNNPATLQTAADNNEDANAVILFTRGMDPTENNVALDNADLSSFRSRKIKYYAGEASHIMRLGDIVNSTPTLVGKPLEAFDKIYKDATYTGFTQRYKNRRQVVYFGANDGMIHAINAGFFDEPSKRFVKALDLDNDSNPDQTEHPLGSELWAYVPYNLLPHLKWLTNPDYNPHDKNHVNYMDLKPRVFDAKIFTPEVECSTQGLTDEDCIHPNGWGTVMVVGMRLGGGAMTVDTAGDGLGAAHDGDTSDDITMRSAYVIMDITDPENPPDLLAEFQIPDGSFSFVYPSVMTFKDAVDWNTDALGAFDTSDDINKWYLIFGSGPKPNYETLELQHVYTYGGEDAHVYILDLEELASPGSTTSIGGLDVKYPSTCDTSCTTNHGPCNNKLCTSYCTDQTLAGETALPYDLITCDTNTENVFLGSPVTVDYNLDYKADMVYFGLVGDTLQTSGEVWRLPIGLGATDASHAYETDNDTPITNSPYRFMETSGSVSAQITPGIDNILISTDTSGNENRGNKWLFFGTGRLYSPTDATKDPEQQTPNLRSLYGVIDPYFSHDGNDADIISDDASYLTKEILLSELMDSTDITVYSYTNADGTHPIANGPTVGGTQITTFENLVASVNQKYENADFKGWYVDFDGFKDDDPTTDEASPRVLSPSALLGGALFTSVYQPGKDCEAAGRSRLYALYYKTGTAFFTPILGEETDPITGNPYSVSFITLGKGRATSPTLHSGAGQGATGVTAIVQKSNLSTELIKSKTTDKIRSGKESWREFKQ